MLAANLVRKSLGPANRRQCEEVGGKYVFVYSEDGSTTEAPARTACGAGRFRAFVETAPLLCGASVGSRCLVPTHCGTLGLVRSDKPAICFLAVPYAAKIGLRWTKQTPTSAL